MGGQSIDSIEVTNGQYAAWLATNPKLANQLTTCSGNASFTPSAGWPATGKDAYPVSNVDWCDGYAYCTWAKKRLCGKIGGADNAYADYKDPAKSQWFKACTGGGVKTFPYGNTYVSTYCNGADYGTGDKLKAGEATGCQGAYPGLFDMSGNVWEWEDSCDTGSMCRIRGGSYTNNTNALDCAVDSSLPRTTSAENVGFRCCSD
jgi:formylglycine-generating enzyme